MGVRQLFSLIFFSLFLNNCNVESSKINKFENSYELNIKLECANSQITLFVKKDTNSNLIISIYNSENYFLEAINGCGNCDTTSNFIKEIKFSKNSNCNEFALSTYINNSTFGAENLFIIWNENNSWHITKTPFLRYEIKDLNNDKYFEIIDYTNENNGVPYCFDNGDLKKYSN